jgi:hypothetical protein
VILKLSTNFSKTPQSHFLEVHLAVLELLHTDKKNMAKLIVLCFYNKIALKKKEIIGRAL